ncbi:hypothetical protein [Oricola sp.]
MIIFLQYANIEIFGLGCMRAFSSGVLAFVQGAPLIFCGTGLVGHLLLWLMLLQGASAWLHLAYLQSATALIMILIVPYLALRGGKVGRVFIALSVLFSVLALIRLDTPVATLSTAMTRAAFFQAFLTAVFMLQDAAMRSYSMNQIGLFLISQPILKQSILTLLGTNLMALMMNLGSLVMIGTLARNRESGSPLSSLENSPSVWITAVSALRGFAASVTWSPLALPPVFLTSLYPTVGLGTTMLVGAAFSVVILIISLLFTLGQAALSYRQDGFPDVQPRKLPRRPIANLASLLVIIFIAIFVAAGTLDISTSSAVTVIIPVTAMLWMIKAHKGSLRTLLRDRFPSIMHDQVPRQAAQTSVIVSAAFLSPVLVALFPVDLVSNALAAAQISAPVLLSSIFLAVILLGMVGINPVLSTSLAAAIFPDPVRYGATPLSMIVILAIGWALAAEFSPYTGTTTIISRMLGISAERLVFEKNGLFLFMSLAITVGSIFLVVS